jgi:transcriptional regulator with XRE-family HTH domain
MKRKIHIVHRLRIKELSESRGVNMSKLSRMADVNFNTIRAIWHNPKRDISLAVLIKIARALRVDVSELYTIEDAE